MAKYCKDCKFYDVNPPLDYGDTWYMCTNPGVSVPKEERESAVHGKYMVDLVEQPWELQFCKRVRSDENLCGQEAKWFVKATPIDRVLRHPGMILLAVIGLLALSPFIASLCHG